MSTTLAPRTGTDDDVFRAFALGTSKFGDDTRALLLVGPGGHAALWSHGVLLALRSEEVVVFDARPRVHCEDAGAVTAHMGRAGVHAHEHFEDHEVECLDHMSFEALADRLGAL